MRILIAEDETATARALKLLLEKSRYAVDIVHNGNDAWEYVKNSRPERLPSGRLFFSSPPDPYF